MKKIHWFSGIVLLTAMIIACSNPFWPKINTVEDEPQTPTVVIYPDKTEAPDGVYYFVNTPQNDVQDLYVTATVTGGGVLTYQWYSYTDEARPDLAELIPTATGFAFKPPVNEIGETFYFVKVTNTLNGKTATAESNHILVKVVDEDTIPEHWLYQVNLTINAPMKGEKPDTNLIISDPVNIKSESIVWSSESGIIEDPDYVFEPNAVYTVTITLKALNDYAFAPVHYLTVPTINNIVILVEGLTESPDQTELTLVLTFSATLDRAVEDIEIKTQPALVYTHGMELNLAGLVVTLIYDVGEPDDFEYEDFGTSFTTSLKHGLVLDHSTHDGQAISVTFNNRITKEIGLLTVTPMTITNVDLLVTAPQTGLPPSNTATIAPPGEVNFSVAGVTWTPSHNPFQGNTTYKVMITVEADEHYVFTEDEGQIPATINTFEAYTESYSGNTAVISYEFTTEARAPSSISVQTQPKLVYNHNEHLDLTLMVVRISYNDSTYKDVNYTNFTSEGISPNYANNIPLVRSTHHNKPVIVTLGSLPPANTNNLTVNAASISNAVMSITPPDVGQKPDTNATGEGNFTSAVSWNPNHDPFQVGVAYTVTIKLTAEENYAFAGTFTATINGLNATISGGIQANEVSFTFTFPALSDAVITGIVIKSQPTELNYTHGDVLDLSGLIITVSYDKLPDAEGTVASFMGVITTNPANGAVLTHVGNNGHPVVVSHGSVSRSTSNLNVAKMPLTIVSASPTAVKNYDNTTATAGPVEVVLSPVAAIDNAANVRANIVTAAYTGINAGTNTINVTGVTLTSNNPGAADAAWRNYEVTPRNNIPVSAIARKQVTITPNSGQNRVFGTTDPVLTFNTGGETIIGGNPLNVQTGALSRAAGTNAGAYAINIGTLSWGSNYDLSLSTPTVNFTITQAAGSAVSPFTASQITTSPYNRITITAATLASATGQTIEYAYSETATVPASGWNPITSLPVTISSGIEYGKTYYVFARTIGNQNYQAGTPSTSGPISVTKAAGSAVSLTASQVTASPYNRITITAELERATGQTIEYAYGETTSVPAAGSWNPVTSHSEIISVEYGKTYYVFARTIERDHYLAGTHNMSGPISVNKAAGAAVSVPVLTSTYNSISITTSLSGNAAEQNKIQYRVRTESTESAWAELGTPPTVSGLNPGTQYWIDVRAMESDNYAVGNSQTATRWTTVNAPLTQVNITFDPLEDNPANALKAPEDPIVLKRGDATPQVAINIPSEGFTTIQWFLNGNEVESTGTGDWQYILRGNSFTQWNPIENILSVEVDEKYSLVIPFRVNP
ncbi:MAG: hypothetical protein FWD13_05695 [Treponema sp.]|nr:hypothetical protein [Treponema sp.]